MSDPATDVELILRNELARLVATFRESPDVGLDYRAAVMMLIRSMDYSYWHELHSPLPLTEEHSQILELMVFGFNRTIAAYLRDGPEEGVPLFPATEELSEWSDAMLQNMGRVVLCEHLLALARLGLAKVGLNGSKISIELRADLSGMDSRERDEVVWYLKETRKLNADDEAELWMQRPPIRAALRQMVDVWRDHYIQYGSTPELDIYFFELAGIRIRSTLGSDAFPPQARFGGIPFGVYTTAAQWLMSFSLKHEAMMTELLVRHPHLNPRDLTTVRVQPRQKHVDTLVTALDGSWRAANRIVEAMTLSPRNIADHTDSAGVITAPFIEVARGQLVEPLHSSHRNPFPFLLRELRLRYRRDWDSAVEGREDVFRSDLYQFFRTPRYRLASRGIALKRPNGTVLTDVDAAILDESDGTLGLFQLKWQDALGLTVRERFSRRRNFAGAGNEWVQRVSEWLDAQDDNNLARLLSLPHGTMVARDRIRLFVIGRNTVEAVRPFKLSPLAAWSTWALAVKSILEQPPDDCSVQRLHERISEQSARSSDDRTFRTYEFDFAARTMRVTEADVTLG